jgi:hypothetical protein
LSLTLAHAAVEIGTQFNSDRMWEGGEMKPRSGRPKTMVALALALVFLLSGCPDGGSVDPGGGGYNISSRTAGG